MFGMRKKKPSIQTNYHIRFNRDNEHHSRAAEYMSAVKGKYKTAFIAAAIEAYRKAHPYGIDYEELEEIQKGSWSPVTPKTPILENLKNRPGGMEQPPVPPNNQEPLTQSEPAQQGSTEVPASKGLYAALDFFDIE